MLKLKVFFIIGVVVSILVLCAFAPGICIDRFVLPDGCCNDCAPPESPCGNYCTVNEDLRCACR